VIEPESISLDGMPLMMSTMSLRLVPGRPSGRLIFTADIDGFIRIMEETDDSHLAKVTLKRVICQKLSLKNRLIRHLQGWMPLQT
jgi:hypothetical protein